MRLFDFAAERLVHHTDFDRLEARGTLRIALKEAGLDPNSLLLNELEVVLERVMPELLGKRGVENAARVCSQVAGDLAQSHEAQSRATSADEIFQRLGGDR